MNICDENIDSLILSNFFVVRENYDLIVYDITSLSNPSQNALT